MKSFNKINFTRFNRTIKTLALGAVVAMTCSCEDFLTIYPTDKVVLENYWKTKTDVENVVANSYRLMTETSVLDRLIVWGELRSDNVVEGTYDANKHGDIKKIMEANLLPQNGYTSWGSFYSVINNCNIVLHFAPNVLDEDPDFTEGDLNVTRGEMLAMRALCHFYLVRTFRDIPLLDEAKIDDDQELYAKQVSPIEALDFILKDLYEAESLVMASGSYPALADNKGRITKDAVRAMIADALLWKAAFTKYYSGKDTNCDALYTECIAFCDSIINERNAYVKEYEAENPQTVNPYRGKVDNKYPLVHHPIDIKNARYLDGPYQEIFSDGNCLRESILELQHSTNASLGNYEVPYFYGNDLSVGPLAASKFLAKAGDNGLYAETDYRCVSFVQKSEGDTELYPIIKYCYELGNGTIDKPLYGINSLKTAIINTDKDRYYLPGRNWIVYRVSDVMLMKAEALAYRNDTVAPGNKDLVNSFDLVKAVYYRSNPYIKNTADSISYTVGNAESLQELVLAERQRELAFEGKRWYDLVRKALNDGETGPMLDLMVDRKYTDNQRAIRSKLASMNTLFFPIQEGELKTNPLLKQNEAYETEDVFEKK